MGRPILDSKIIDSIIELRRTGHSLPEIRKITGKGNATVYKYSKNVPIDPEYGQILRLKQGGSRKRQKQEWERAKNVASHFFPSITNYHKILILACLYWGEGRKASSFDLINSDPDLVRVFVNCLEELGVTKDRLHFSIRMFSDMNTEEVVNFWVNLLKIQRSQIIGVDILEGKKKGKLQYGMCRLRVIKGGQYFKQVMSIIDLIKNNI